MQNFFVGVLFVALILGNMALIFSLRKGALLARLVPADSWESINGGRNRDMAWLRKLLPKENWVTGSGDIDERAIAALKWTMNRVQRIGSTTGADPQKLLAVAEAGSGLGCAGMATIYSAVLSSIDIKNRTVSLSRNMLDAYDSHTIVEVCLEAGRWAVFDPTFNISFIDRDGGLMSAQDIKAQVFHEFGAGINVVFHGEVAYPARWDRYYLNIFKLFNNVFVNVPGTRRGIFKLPPLRFWFGPRLYYLKLPYESTAHLDSLNRLYLLAVVLLPILILLVFGWLCLNIIGI